MTDEERQQADDEMMRYVAEYESYLIEEQEDTDSNSESLNSAHNGNYQTHSVILNAVS